jgi:hypothetical protein
MGCGLPVTHWLIRWAQWFLLVCGLVCVVGNPVFGKELEYTDWQGEFSRRVKECGKILDQAYPPLQIPVSALNLDTLSLSTRPELVVEVELKEPREEVKKIFWRAKDHLHGQTFIEDVQSGQFQSFLIERSARGAGPALKHHSTILLMGLSLGKRDPKYDETLRKLSQFLQDLNHCPTPNLIKIFHPCTRCPIKEIAKSPS